MGSDVGVRVPPLDPAAARARRSLAAARAARDGITSMVDSLRISKPPRAPLHLNAGISSSVPAARRHALIPLAEGRPELEARIRALEDAIASRDTELVRLKRQWGRALVRRKQLENDLGIARAEASALRETARAYSTAATTSRKRLTEFVEDIAVPLPGLHTAARDARSANSHVAEDIGAAVDDIEEVLSTARDFLAKQPSLPALPVSNEANGVVLPGLTQTPLKARFARGTTSTAGSDDDARSCASFASSTGFGEDREAQLDTLAELVDILEAKISSGAPHVGASSTVSRAKRTLDSSRPREPKQVSDLIAERDRLKNQLNAVLAEKENMGGEDAALALAARAEAELRDAKKEITVMSERIASLEKIASRAVDQEELNSRNAVLEGELRSAKKTVGRLVQERNALRRTTPGSGVWSNSSNSHKPRGRGNPEAMRRILDWRQRASTESHEGPQSPHIQSSFENGHAAPADTPNPDLMAEVDKAEPLPDRVTPGIFDGSPIKKRRVDLNDAERPNGNDAQSVSDRSLDVGVNDSVSAQSVPVRGFLRRHDSFLSAGNVSASGDEITITNNRNIFNMAGRSMDGLRGLLGGS